MIPLISRKAPEVLTSMAGYGTKRFITKITQVSNGLWDMCNIQWSLLWSTLARNPRNLTRHNLHANIWSYKTFNRNIISVHFSSLPGIPIWLILFYLISLTVYSEEYRLWNPLLYNYLNHSVISLCLQTNILLSNLFQNSLKLHSI